MTDIKVDSTLLELRGRVLNRSVKEYTQINPLDNEEQVRIKVLESKTDRVYGLRSHLAHFLRANNRYIKAVEVPIPPNELDQRREELAKAQQAALPETPGERTAPPEWTAPEARPVTSYLKRRDLNSMYEAYKDKKVVQSLVDWDAVERDADQYSATQPRAEQALAREWYIDKIKFEFQIAMEDYADLTNAGGDRNNPPANPDDEDVLKYYQMRWGELSSVVDIIQLAEHEQAMGQKKIDFIMSHRSAYRNQRLYDTAITEATADLKTQADKVKGLIETNPEAYLYTYGRYLKEAKETFDQGGRIVETPYVKAKINEIMGIVASGRPVFIHGELGAGKTELARHIAETRLSAPHLKRWEQTHPRPVSPALSPTWESENPRPVNNDDIPHWLVRKELADQQFAKVKQEAQSNYDQELQLWETLRAEQAKPLVVGGHRALELEQITGARTISRTEAPPPEEQLNIINDRWAQYRFHRITEAGNNADEAFLQRLDTTERELFQDAYLESFKKSVETQIILGPFLQAMSEGRPYVEDEMNAIPHHIQIIKNDLLTRRPGDIITPPFADAQPFKVQEGFCYLGTGNYKPEDGQMYIGRQPFDAAFLSRMGIVSYDYLPNSRDYNTSNDAELAEALKGDQLLHMLITRLLNDDLSLTLPKNGLEKVTSLALAARNLQDVFSGKETTSAYGKFTTNGGEVKTQTVLKENVLSIRHLIPILEAWKKDNYSRDLDYYVMSEYVRRSSARPEELKFLYQVLQVQENFFDVNAPGSPWVYADKVDNFDMAAFEQLMYGSDMLTGQKAALPERPEDNPLVTLELPEVITKLFGAPPKRTQIPTEYFEDPAEQAATAQLALEQARARENTHKNALRLEAALKAGGHLNYKELEDLFGDKNT